MSRKSQIWKIVSQDPRVKVWGHGSCFGWCEVDVKAGAQVTPNVKAEIGDQVNNPMERVIYRRLWQHMKLQINLDLQC